MKTLRTARHRALVTMLIGARVKAGMTQTDFAKALGEYQSFVARLESGERRIDVVELIYFSEILGFDPKLFISELEAMTNI